jgi:hypothetical protein
MSRVALVVGINNYDYRGLRNLSAPSEDAEAIAQRLEKYGDFDLVIRLPEVIEPDTKKPLVGKVKELTFVSLEEALENLFCPDSKQVPDTALFYFSGHGLLKKRGEGFLATSDTNPTVGLNGLSLRWLRELLQASPIKQQIVWLDCCHSGAIINVSEANAGESGHARDRCFIAASRDFENSYQAIGSSYSVLTKALLDGLDSQQVTAKGLNNYELVAFFNEAMRGELQQPTFSNFGQPITLIRRWEDVKAQKQDVEINSVCPYKGLAYFEDNDVDSQLFFGRTKLTDLLIDRVRQSNFLALLGASGSGKSSVLRAGLLNQLRQGRQLSGSDRWEFRVMLPGEHPLTSLAAAFVEPELEMIERAAKLKLAEDFITNGIDGLRQLITISKAPRVLLVIDQFEEVFTLCQDLSEREKFFACLIKALEIGKDKFCLAISMRADFFGKCVEREYGGLAKRIESNLVAVTPMTEAELREAIAKPAKLVGCEVEPVLTDEIVRDVAGSPANLPLMQFALTELWKHRVENSLTLMAYKQELGGIIGALEKRADRVYADFTEIEQKAVKYIFLALTQLGKGTEDTRRRVVLKNLPTGIFPLEVIEKVVKKLADEKLVVTSVLIEEDGKLQKDAIVDVAHEALIRNWKRLRGWLNENRQSLEIQRKLENRAEDWQNAGKSKDYLLQGRSLRDAKEFVQSQKSGGNATIKDFAIAYIKASEKKQNGDQLRFFSTFLIFPFIGSLVALHFYILNLAQKILTTDDCNQNPEIKQLLEYMIFTGQKGNLYQAKLCNEKLSGINLQGASLSKADFRKASLSKANLEGAFLEGADFRDANLSSAKFKDASLKDAKLEGSVLLLSDLSDSKYLTEAQVISSKLCKTKLPNHFHLDPDRDCDELSKR